MIPASTASFDIERMAKLAINSISLVSNYFKNYYRCFLTRDLVSMLPTAVDLLPQTMRAAVKIRSDLQYTKLQGDMPQQCPHEQSSGFDFRSQMTSSPWHASGCFALRGYDLHDLVVYALPRAC
jgi:hypothetical protein